MSTIISSLSSSTRPAEQKANSISGTYNSQQPIQALSISANQRLAAIGSCSHVKVIRLDKSLIKQRNENNVNSNSNIKDSIKDRYRQIPLLEEYCALPLKSFGNFTITDVEWSPDKHESPGKIAAASTDGSIVVFNVEDYLVLSSNSTANISTLKGSTSNANLSSLAGKVNKKMSQKWETGEITRSVHKVAWNPCERDILGAASQDGSVRLYDVRTKSGVSQSTFSMRADVARNLQFDPFQPNNFAVIYENGGVAIWDARKDDIPFLKVAAHTTCGLSLAWHPYKPSHLATGSRDKTCKVWNFSPNSEEYSISKPIFSLYTPAAIAFIAWRPSNKHHNQIATTSVETGDISIWDIEFPNVPACILRGHKEAVTGFAWLDTPLGGPSSSTNALATNIVNPSNQKTKQNIPSIVPFTNDITEHDGYDSLDLQFFNVHQHILSVSKDGHAHIQDLRSGYFPRQHIASSLTAISSKGHVAYQRGLISREDPLGLITFPQYTDLGLFNDRPASFGMEFPNEIENISDKKLVNNVNNDEVNDKEKSVVSKIGESISQIKHTSDCSSRIFVGLAEFSNLSQAKEVREFRSAEGNIFDMAMINLLARSYRLGREIEHESIKRDYFDKLRLVHEAMVHNLDIALDAGLKCRAAVWESVLTLLPSLTNCTSFSQPIVKEHGLSIIISQESETGTASPSSLASPTNKQETKTQTNIGSTGSSFDGLPFSVSILGSILLELIEIGDCQHFVVLCEILRFADLLEMPISAAKISEQRCQEAYLTYLDMLTKLQLFTVANTIIKFSITPNISNISKQGVMMHTACAKCGKEIPENCVTPWCSKCKRCPSLCSICYMPVRGLLNWCPLCGHGGHLECTRKWFKKSVTCPAGCGHDCSNEIIENEIEDNVILCKTSIKLKKKNKKIYKK